MGVLSWIPLGQLNSDSVEKRGSEHNGHSGGSAGCTGPLLCQEDWAVSARCCVKVIWEAVYSKRSVLHVRGHTCDRVGRGGGGSLHVK